MKTLGNYKIVRYAIIFFALVQSILIYDTIRNNPSNKREGMVRKDSSILKINGDVLDMTAQKEAKDAFFITLLEHNDDDSVESSIHDPNNENDSSFKTRIHDQDSGQRRRTVYWLDYRQIGGEVGDVNSGSLLMPINYLQLLEAPKVKQMIHAIYQMQAELKSEIRLPVDWLDFSIEDTTEWYSELDLLNDNHNDVAINKITGNLVNYVTHTPEKTRALLSAKSKPDLHPTIAIIPVNPDFKDDSLISAQRSANLTMTTLGATISSLVRAGVGRIVCTGIGETDELLTTETLAWIAEIYADKMDWIANTEISYVRMDEELYKTDSEKDNRLGGSIYGLQKALQREFNASYSGRWMGQNPEKWKYVIVTEPGFVHQTRATSLPAIRKALERGRVLIPHRFLPIRHENDLTKDNILYNGNTHFVSKDLIEILDLDGENDMCCDGGNNRPNWNERDDPTDTRCSSWWWNCGYTRDWQEADILEKVRHRRLLDYAPLIRVKQGIDIVSLPGTRNRRKCHPRKRRTQNEICERPSPSGRSFTTFEASKKK